MIVLLPSLGMTMVEGEIKEWLVDDGAYVEKGTPLYELTTDKLTNEVEAPASGTLKILVPQGSKVPCNTPIAEITE